MKDLTRNVLWVNCDGDVCGFHYEARENMPTGKYGSMRCMCGRILGIGEWKRVDRIKARTEIEAIEIYKKRKNERLDN